MTEYNPMSKEFQEEANRLGLTGRQLTEKYRKEGKSIIRKINVSHICCICESHDTYVDSIGYAQWHKHKCQKLMCTGYLCRNCYRKYDPNSDHNIMKSLSDRRTDNQNSNHSNVLGDKCQKLTCIWRSTVSTVSIEDLNKKLDNYCNPIDHSRDSELGIIQTKGRLYDSINGLWQFHFKNEHRTIRKGFKFDNVICYCISKDGKNVDRLYIFPIKEIEKRSGVSITKNPTNRRYVEQWYENYRVIDDEILKKVDRIWQQI